MYMRVKRFRNKDGSVREYLYIVKGVRVDGKPRQKVVAYLGRLDELRGYKERLKEDLFRRRQDLFSRELTLCSLTPRGGGDDQRRDAHRPRGVPRGHL